MRKIMMLFIFKTFSKNNKNIEIIEMRNYKNVGINKIISFYRYFMKESFWPSGNRFFFCYVSSFIKT